ncbi:3-isopropylmalate dehydratase [Sphingobacterium sp. DR205]|uniref:3-isopropylmalate dehydratase n=1 Tax=Sphingobacterium sp. DR205 TaxID=2713573 RepID=UPI0013E469A5|nr:3-isopropylmalate dehydratase [Sphingobacterium sp. DR205]QIH34526.1 3-isopropylmalate dehydratase [Sphingobacterium sp. DR205]
MKITDLNGCELKVTDLEKAIEQAENFKDMHHIPKDPTDGEKQEYWNDIYNKLLELKDKLNHEQLS